MPNDQKSWHYNFGISIRRKVYAKFKILRFLINIFADFSQISTLYSKIIRFNNIQTCIFAGQHGPHFIVMPFLFCALILIFIARFRLFYPYCALFFLLQLKIAVVFMAKEKTGNCLKRRGNRRNKPNLSRKRRRK